MASRLISITFLLALQIFSPRSARAVTLMTLTQDVMSLQNQIVRAQDHAKTLLDKHDTQKIDVWFTNPVIKQHRAIFAQLNILKENSIGNAVTLIRIEHTLREMRHQIKLAAQILDEQKSAHCFEQMKQDGDLLALSDDNATRLYSRYLHNYLDQGGTIIRTVNTNFQNSDRTTVRIRAMESKANLFQESHLAENYRVARLTWPKSRTYLVRHTVKLCPLTGTHAVRLLVPHGVEVQDQQRGQTAIFYEEGRRWSVQNAVMYSDTDMSRYPFHQAHLEYQRIKKSAWSALTASFSDPKLARR